MKESSKRLLEETEKLIQQEQSKIVAKTILQQIDAIPTMSINGAKVSNLKIMGAEHFLYEDNSVQFKVKGSKRFNSVVIKLNAMDTYDVELWQCKVLSKEPYIINDKVEEINDVYNDVLGEFLVNKVLYS